MEKKDSPGLDAPSPWRGPLGLLVVAGLVVASLLFLTRSGPPQNRILLLCAVDGEDESEAGLSGRLVMELGHRLQGMGFEVATVSHPAVAAALAADPENLDRAQSAVKARWRARVTMRFEERTTAVPGDYRELQGVGQVIWRNSDGAAGGAQPLLVWGGSRQAGLTRAELISGAIVHRAAAFLARALVLDEAVSVAAGGKPTPALGPARTAVEAADVRLRAVAATETLVSTNRAAADHGPFKSTLYDAFDARRLICGAGAKGALVWRIPSARPGKDGVMDSERYQRLGWRSTAGEGAQVWMGPRLHGPATTSADGETVAFSEVIYTWARTLTVADHAGTRRLVTAPTTTFTALALSPGGQHLAAYARRCTKCARRLVVYRTGDGVVTLDADDEGGTLAGFAWADNDRLLVLHTPQISPAKPRPGARRFPGSEQGLWAISMAAPDAAPKRVFSSPDGRRYLSVISGHGQAILVPGSGAGHGLQVVSLTDGRAHFIRSAHRVTDPQLAPDGRDLLFNLHFGGDTEVALVPLAGGTPTVLTKNSLHDRRPVFSADGARVLYEAVARDDTLREVSSIASIDRPAPTKSP